MAQPARLILLEKEADRERANDQTKAPRDSLAPNLHVARHYLNGWLYSIAANNSSTESVANVVAESDIA